MTKTILLLGAASLALTGCGEGGGKAGGGTAASAGENAAAAVSPAGTDWTTTVVATPEGGMRMGNPDAPVKLVEFASMTCSHCRDFSAESNPALYERYVKSGQVSFEFRNFVTNQIDVVASLLARCGGPQPFFKLTEQMFANQDEMLNRVQAGAAQLAAAEQAPGQQTFVKVAEVAGLDKFVGMRGIPAAKANACLTNEAELNRLVEMNAAAAKQYKLPGTPSFLINGQLVEGTPAGSSIWTHLESKLKEAGAKA